MTVLREWKRPDFSKNCLFSCYSWPRLYTIALDTQFLFDSAIGDTGKMGGVIQLWERRKMGRREVRRFAPDYAVGTGKCLNMSPGHSDTK